MRSKVRVGINGFGTIGKRVADAVTKQDDMELVGVVKTKPDYEAKIALLKGYRLYVPGDSVEKFRKAGVEVAGTVEDLLKEVDVIVDATPAGVGRGYKPLYEKFGVKAIFQGGEKADVAEVSFNALCNYERALGKRFVRVVSCNTTGLCRAIYALKTHFGIESVFAVIVRRGADPKEVKRGPINAIVLDPPKLPSHHGPDVKTVVPDIDITTAAVAVPTTLMHVHIVRARLKSRVSRDDVIRAFEETPRILLVSAETTKILSTAQVVEFFRDVGRARYDIPELVVWEDSITVEGDTVTFVQGVHQEAIVVPENIDAIRAVTELVKDGRESVRKTDTSLGISTIKRLKL